MISVIITVHPPLLPYLKRCVDSVCWQLRPEDELVIVLRNCDCPIELEASLAATRQMVGYSLQVLPIVGPSKSPSNTRNWGCRKIRGEWIKFLDGDDLLAPFALNACRAAAPKLPADVAVLAGAVIKVEEGVVRDTVSAPDVERCITQANPLLVSMAFIRTSVFRDVRGFDERFEFEEDWEFWLRLRAQGHRFARMLPPVCYYWINAAERAAKQRNHTVEDMDVRAWLAQTYGITPQA